MAIAHHRFEGNDSGQQERRTCRGIAHHRWLSPGADCDDNEVCMTGQNDSFSESVESSRHEDAGLAAKSSLDEAMDAVVYDVHPATVIRPEDLYREAPLFSFQPPAPAEYKVPQRFGMAAILGIMTALAILFGGFRLMNAEPVVYLFFGVQSLVICLVQMFNGKAPRAASVVAGAILAPLFAPRLFATDVGMWGPWRPVITAVLVVLGVPVGAFLGYLTGTCAAGIFLVMDYLEPYLQGNSSVSLSRARPTP
jgi:hypothetical protein